MLRKRILTALIAGVLLLFLLWLGQIGFVVAWSSVGLLLLFEWTEGENMPSHRRPFLLYPILPLWLAHADSIFLKAALVALMGLIGVSLFLLSSQEAWEWTRQVLFGTVVFGVGWGAVGWILYEPYSMGRVIAFLSLAWVSDTAAYAVGRTLGRTPILPHISPQKTLEGLLGSLVATSIWAHWAVPWIGGFGKVYPAIVGFCVALVGFFGDAFQSMWKRAHGLKDSGSFLPGHGGFWDRVDSLIWIAPFWYFLGDIR
ncbi:MAG: phosphatidate cytidylyltransferase [Bacteroidia bacterium]|nr:phosphatidate cytidylyltransferase [Bacteroidia bacterium]MDW8015870.1 phosphatidate cytidylyltransferase [Bacteroidia bacterium]